MEEKDYIHGGNIYFKNIDRDSLIDFSSNINPLGLPKSFTNNIGEALKNASIYPDINYSELKDNIGKQVNCPQDYIVLGNGAAEIIDLVISEIRKILIVVPSFVEYEICAKKWSCEIEYFYLDDDMEINYNKLFKALHYCDGLIIGNPNNPNGGIIERDKFMEILNYAELNNKTIVIDEAFVDFVLKRQSSFIDLIQKYKSLFIIRALTKFFALPGVRFGYGISSNIELIRNIKKRQNPWNINCFAEIAVKYVLKDKEYIEKSREWIGTEITYFLQELRKMSIFEKVYETNCNFVLCKLRDTQNDDFYNKLLRKGFLIRKATNFRGLDKQYVRFAVKDRNNNEKFIKVVKKLV